MAKLPKEITDEIYQSGYEKGFSDGYDKANATFELEYYQGHTLGEAYSDGKEDGAREFAEWLCKGVIPQDNPHITYSVREMLNDGSCYEVESEDLLSEWQKGAE